MGSSRVREMPPRGHYLAHEVGRLAGVSGERVGQWARRGYIRSSQSADRPRVYSYQDVAEAMVVHELFNREVAPRSVKKAIAEIRKEFGYDWPLQNVSLRVPPRSERSRGKSKTVVLELAPHVKTDISKPHPVLTDEDLVQVATDLHRGGWAARQLPQLQHIEVDPDRLSGRPVVRGTRVPAEDAGRLATSEAGVAILVEDYDLVDDEIADAREWWHAVQRYEAS